MFTCEKQQDIETRFVYICFVRLLQTIKFSLQKAYHVREAHVSLPVWGSLFRKLTHCFLKRSIEAQYPRLGPQLPHSCLRSLEEECAETVWLKLQTSSRHPAGTEALGEWTANHLKYKTTQRRKKLKTLKRFLVLFRIKQGDVPLKFINRLNQTYQSWVSGRSRDFPLNFCWNWTESRLVSGAHCSHHSSCQNNTL